MDEEHSNLPNVTVMRLTRLEDIETLKPFDCGDDDLNGFLIDDAMFYRQQIMSKME